MIFINPPPASGGSVLCSGQQGLGDEIVFSDSAKEEKKGTDARRRTNKNPINILVKNLLNKMKASWNTTYKNMLIIPVKMPQNNEVMQNT